MIIDHLDDGGAYLDSILPPARAPTFVKTAAESWHSRNTEDFALVRPGARGLEYKYPIMDKGNVVKSALYFEQYGPNALSDAELVETGVKIASALIDYDLPADGVSAILLAAADRANNKVVKTASAFIDSLMVDGPLHNEVERGPERDGLEAVRLVGNICIRKTLLEKEASVQELNSILEESASGNHRLAMERLHRLDVENSLPRLYGSLLVDPRSLPDPNVEKTASAHVCIDGVEFADGALEESIRQHADALSSSLDPTVYEHLSHAPEEILRSLPAPDRAAILSIIARG